MVSFGILFSRAFLVEVLEIVYSQYLSRPDMLLHTHILSEFSLASWGNGLPLRFVKPEFLQIGLVHLFQFRFQFFQELITHLGLGDIKIFQLFGIRI
jgi:hypothetical protein